MSATPSNSAVRKYAGSAAFSLGERIIRIISTAIIGIYLVKFLGPYNYGILSYAQSIIAVAIPLVNLGLGDLFVRDLLLHPDSEGKIIGTALRIRLWAALLSMVLFAVFVILSPFDSQVELWSVILVYLGILFQPLEIIDRFFQAKVQGKLSAYANIVSLGITTLLKIYLLIIGASVIYFAAITALEIAVTGLCLLLFYRKANPVRNLLLYDKGFSLSFIRDSSVLVLSNLAVILYLRLDQFMVRSYLGVKELGYFSAAVKISEFYYFIPVILVNALLPAVITGKKISDTEYRSRLLGLYSIITYIGLFGSLVIAIFADVIVNLLFGSEYLSSIPILRVQAFAATLSFWGMISTKWFVVEGMPKFVTICTISGLAANLVLNLVFIPSYGAVGASFASLLAQSVAVLVVPLIFQRTRQLLLNILQSFNFSYIFTLIKRFKNN